MASTYTTNTGIELITTGEQSGTWGDTTNVNLQIIDRLTNGVGSIALSGTTHTLTTTDGTLSDGHYAVLVFGGSPSGTNTVTVSPNDQQKVFIVKNGSGQTVVLSQGSGANVTLLNGDSKIVYCDGAGASAAVVDVTGDLALSDVNIDGGSIDGVTLGTNSPVTQAQIDNLNLNGNAITSTNANGNIAITPNGTGEVDISKVDIDGGTIDGTVIGGSTPAAGGFTNITVTGTVDGRDVAADGTKLDGIEALADVTDTANVTAAGALMDSELTDITAVKALDQGVATTDSPTFVELTAAQYNSTEALPDIKPSLNLDFANTKALDPRITYTRGSTATYYDGKTFAKAEENLLTYSQEFDNAAWSKTFTDATANSTTAPDGTGTADTLEEDSSTDIHRAAQSFAAYGSVTLSIFAKAGSGSRYLTIAVNNSASNYASATFDLSAGANTQTLVNGTYSSQSATITASTNGFYRCSLTVTTDSISQVLIGLSATSTFSNFSRGFDSYTGDGTSSIILWGAQVEQRDALTDYTATTTQPITNYIPALQTAASGEPRFDHDPITGESKGFLIEEQRTNLLTYSEQFDNAAWSKSNSSVTSNIVVTPDGTLTGDKLVEDTTASSTHLVVQGETFSTADYTFSVYLKAAERTFARVVVFDGTSAFSYYVNLSTGAISGESGTLTANVDDVGNDWYRASLFFSAAAGTGNVAIRTATGGSGSDDSYTGDGYSGIYVWGAQVEAGSFPTSYIPTVASQVTRSSDAASMTGTNFSSWYRQDEGTVFVEASTNQTSFTTTDDRAHLVTLGSPDGQNYVTTYFHEDELTILFRNAGAGTESNALAGVVGGGAFNKTAFVFSGASDAQFAIDSLVSSAFTNRAFQKPTIDRLLIGTSQVPSGRILDGHIKKLAFWPKRLSNATLQALTEE
jgi:hypothetical protein